MDLKKFSFLILAAILVYSCAQQVPITGGEKDTTPPSISEASPENFTTEFMSKKVTLTFDEYVTLKDIKKEFISSPPLNHDPEFIEKGKTIDILIIDTLKENTTYNLNFGNGIVDFTEGNPLDSNLYVFSTGSYIDSLTISGQLKDAFTLQPVPDVYVHLYKHEDETVVYFEKPLYIAKTDEYGVFNFKYLAEGNYQITALKDKNSNFLLDTEGEGFAFYQSKVEAGKADSVSLKMFVETPKKQYFTKTNAEHFGLASGSFNIHVDSFSVRTLPDTMATHVLPVFNTERDSVIFYLYPVTNADTLAVEITADSIIDTVVYRIPSYEKFLKEVEKGKPTVQLEISAETKNNMHNYFDTLYIQTNHPIKSFDTSMIDFVTGNDTLPADSYSFVLEPAFTDFTTDTIYNNRIAFIYPWQKGADYQFIYYPNLVKDIYGLTNEDTLSQNFHTRKFEEYGSLVLKLIPGEKQAPQYILQLLTDKNEVYQEDILKGIEEVEYELLVPGKYHVRLIYDTDSDGKWTTGNYDEKRFAEDVIYFPELIEIRANWDKDYDWNLE